MAEQSLDPKDKRAVQIEREHGVGLKPGTIKKAMNFVSKAPKSHPEFWSERHLHTAKNPQTCTHCKEPINVGQQYYRWKWPNRDTIRVHEHHRFEGNLVKDLVEKATKSDKVFGSGGKNLQAQQPDERRRHGRRLQRVQCRHSHLGHYRSRF